MVREDLINGAVSFLQDPSVASAPLEQRIAFLKSKNLTQEEIDVSLQRVGSESVAPSSQSPIPQGYNYPPPQYRQGGGYGNYASGYWPPPPPPEPPRRDWRDWFIMATVVGGVGYGAFTLAKRYIYPVIAPPTPPQLEQDKASIDASFDKAFALLDQLSTDTEELKAAEKARTERLDVALTEVETVIAHMRDATRRRDDEVRRTNDEVRSLRDLIPKAIKAQEDSADTRLKELAKEMQGLRTLIANRVNPGRATPPAQAHPPPVLPETQAAPGINSNSTTPAFAPPPSIADSPSTNGGPSEANEDKPSLSATQLSARSGASSPHGARMNGRAKIPAWQMAAQKASDEASGKDTSESGTVVDANSA